MNIVLIVLDSLRRDHLGCYGNDWIKTPNIDRFASQSVTFDNAYAEGLPTIPVRTELVTGQTSLPFREWQPLIPQDVTAAELLGRYGYTCGLVADNYHLFEAGMNFHRAMHSFRWIRGQECDAYKAGPAEVDTSRYVPPGMKGSFVEAMLGQYLRNVAGREGEEQYFAAAVMSEAVKWLRESSSSSPFFLWVDSFDPHEPWDPPPPFDTMYAEPAYDGHKIIHPNCGPTDWLSPDELANIKALYAGEVSFVDKWVGKLLDALDELKLAEDTLVLMLADHGHPHGDHGVMLKSPRGMYAELVRIPLMLRHPKGDYAGTRVDALVQIRDVLPTLLDLAGLPAAIGVHGASMWPLVTGETDSLRECVVCGWHQFEYRAVRDKRWALVVTPSGQQDELYDMASDPNEQTNVISAHPDVAERMRRFLGEYTYTKSAAPPRQVQLRYEVEHTSAG